MTVLFLSRLNRTVTSIYRDMNAGQEDAGGQTPPPDWELVATEVPCRATVTAAVEPVDAEKTVVVEDRRVAVPVDTDVTEADQLGAIAFEDGTVKFPGPMNVRGVYAYSDHLELVVEQIR